jgi:Protein of unknown function (DUF2911)
MIRRILVVVGILLVLIVLFMVFGRKYYTKRFSPEDHTELNDGGFRALVFYNRPYKRGREIFGGLVPYGKVWRTGANEATWFEVNRDVKFVEQILREGRYSLWTIPEEKSWKVIFNSTIPPWGVDYNSNAARDPSADVLVVEMPVSKSETLTEQFTISLSKKENGYQMDLIWDRTIISLPFQITATSDK